MDIERFAWFEPWLARGGQPPKDALRELAAQGVRIVVNLREHDETRDVEKVNMLPVHIPVKNDRAPSDAQVRQWLALCERNGSSERERIFIHCKGGEGRTSVFCAALRMAQGVSVEDAIAEQRAYGFEPEGTHAEQAQYLREFAARMS